jgi:hypothetical protein
MATFPGREAQCQQAVESLLPQVTALSLYLNGYPPEQPTPWVPCTGHLRVQYGAQRHGDLGDVGKVAACDDALETAFGQVIRLLCDDDILYPPDYVATLAEALHRYDDAAVVGVHAKRINGPVRSYYRDAQTFHCRQGLSQDTRVHLLGTGTLAYHTGTLRLHHTQFPVPNMADIWFGLLAQRQRLPLVAIARAAEWVRVLDCDDTIWDRSHQHDALQTALVNSLEWRLW